ncbi:hypothetical protein [Alkalihalobacillus sp. AL-G]|uniref:hypothetical protein n=1 Tax=Alkalihalobacillus sp. AL-G TaxID=2926399 RepID=UPI00272DC630|nr:hypothetical protein [Alkalihalobacillus sp. AL-G]WLD92821.1 hypothetical protein MOJ78_17705 [Alkalihalobacillus sp. AL-G]
MKSQLKNILFGIVVFIIGFLVVGFFSSSKGSNVELSYFAAIAYSLLFLASVVTVCTCMVVNALKK